MSTKRKLGKKAGYICLAIGICMLIVTIWAFSQPIFSFNSYLFLRIILGFDIFVICASILGIIGIKKKISAFVCIFQLLVLGFFLILIIIGVFARVLPGIVFNGNCTQSNNPLISIAHQASVMGKKICTLDCPCGLTDNTINNGNYTDLQKLDLKNNFKRDQQGATQFQGCEIAKNIDPQIQAMFLVFSAIQPALKCSGWCSNQSSLVYRFSDVNNGKPQSTCYDFMKDNLSSFSKVIQVSAFIGSFFMGLVLLFGLFLCCTKQQKQVVMFNNGVYRTL